MQFISWKFSSFDENSVHGKMYHFLKTVEFKNQQDKLIRIKMNFESEGINHAHKTPSNKVQTTTVQAFCYSNQLYTVMEKIRGKSYSVNHLCEVRFTVFIRSQQTGLYYDSSYKPSDTSFSFTQLIRL